MAEQNLVSESPSLMNDPNPALNPPRTVADREFSLRRFREYVAAGIAGVVVLGTIIMLLMAVNTIGHEEQFSNVKDLLLIINPLLGVVLGYYFNKASTEARAENAEATAKDAVANAQQAIKAREAAQAEAKEAKEETGEMWTALTDVNQAVEKMMAVEAPVAATVRVLGEGESDTEQKLEVLQARREVQAALERAKRAKK